MSKSKITMNTEIRDLSIDANDESIGLAGLKEKDKSLILRLFLALSNKKVLIFTDEGGKPVGQRKHCMYYRVVDGHRDAKSLETMYCFKKNMEIGESVPISSISDNLQEVFLEGENILTVDDIRKINITQVMSDLEDRSYESLEVKTYSVDIKSRCTVAESEGEYLEIYKNRQNARQQELKVSRILELLGEIVALMQENTKSLDVGDLDVNVEEDYGFAAPLKEDKKTPLYSEVNKEKKPLVRESYELVEDPEKMNSVQSVAKEIRGRALDSYVLQKKLLVSGGFDFKQLNKDLYSEEDILKLLKILTVLQEKKLLVYKTKSETSVHLCYPRKTTGFEILSAQVSFADTESIIKEQGDELYNLIESNAGIQLEDFKRQFLEIDSLLKSMNDITGVSGEVLFTNIKYNQISNLETLTKIDDKKAIEVIDAEYKSGKLKELASTSRKGSSSRIVVGGLNKLRKLLPTSKSKGQGDLKEELSEVAQGAASQAMGKLLMEKVEEGKVTKILDIISLIQAAKTFKSQEVGDISEIAAPTEEGPGKEEVVELIERLYNFSEEDIKDIYGKLFYKYYQYIDDQAVLKDEYQSNEETISFNLGIIYDLSESKEYFINQYSYCFPNLESMPGEVQENSVYESENESNSQQEAIVEELAEILENFNIIERMGYDVFGDSFDEEEEELEEQLEEEQEEYSYCKLVKENSGISKT